MSYQILWDPRTEHDLRKIGREGAKRILTGVTTKLIHNPKMGKLLETNLPLWSFRVGVYRVLYFFSENKLVIWAIRVGHRKDIYKKLDTIELPEDYHGP